jgi:hypothetical protein
MKKNLHLLVGTLAILAGAMALAQARPDASGAAYRSAFEGYQAYEDVAVGDWRALNDAVRPAPDKTASGTAAPAPAQAASAPARLPSGPGDAGHGAHHGGTK